MVLNIQIMSETNTTQYLSPTQPIAETQDVDIGDYSERSDDDSESLSELDDFITQDSQWNVVSDFTECNVQNRLAKCVQSLEKRALEHDKNSCRNHTSHGRDTIPQKNDDSFSEK